MQENSHFSQTQGKSKEQQTSEELVKDIVVKTNGVLCNLENAEHQLIYFEKRKVKGRPNPYTFTIGSQITIEVAEYVKVTEPKFLNAWKVMHTTGANVTKSVKYFQNDEELKVMPSIGKPEIEAAQQPVSETYNANPVRNEVQMEVDAEVSNFILMKIFILKKLTNIK